MADDETPETTEEQVTPAAETTEGTAPAEQAEAAPAPEAAAKPAAEPIVALTPKERKVASRARRGVRRGATPEERTETRQAQAAETITVRIDTARRHRRYQKIVRSSSTLHAHDETNDANTGDTVRIIESRPLSATKRWRLVEILERAK